MTNHEPQRRIHLAAGDFYFGQGDLTLRTVLGSCVTITLWHTALRMGGMSHCLLPEFPSSGDDRTTLYVEGAIQEFSQHLLRVGARPSECVVKLLGGGNMFPQPAGLESRSNIYPPLSLRVGAREIGHGASAFMDGGGIRAMAGLEVGQRNVEAARRMLQQAGFTISNEHVGGNGHRVVIFDLTSGDTWLRAPNSVDG